MLKVAKRPSHTGTKGTPLSAKPKKQPETQPERGGKSQLIPTGMGAKKISTKNKPKSWKTAPAETRGFSPFMCDTFYSYDLELRKVIGGGKRHECKMAQKRKKPKMARF